MFDPLKIFFVDALKWIYSWVGNYGWSVVVFTLMIRIVIFPLTFKSRKGMRAMQKVQPKMAELQKKYADDKEKLNAKTMELYKKEHVSPGASCLPMLLQFPILILMFTAMRVFANEQTIQMLLNLKDGGSITLQSWLWIKNVFQPDSFMASILPAAGDPLAIIQKVGYSSILTQENIEAARAYLQTSEYAAIAAQYGADAFTRLQLNFVFVAPVLTIPSSFHALLHSTNGLFLLPLLAGLSQFFMNKVMNPEQQKKTEAEKIAEQQNASANAMNSGFMKWFFPLFSVWICATSNAAFSIYWMAVNVISIIETAALNKYFDNMDKKEAMKAALDD